MKKTSLKKVYEKYYKDKFSYPTFRSLFLEHKDKFKDVEIIKFPKRTTYNILNEEDFINTFNTLINIEKI